MSELNPLSPPLTPEQEKHMKTWTNIDKSAWPKGPWNNEPDKAQWVDEATGLDCLAVRHSHSGHWCGYVGVAEGHPFFGVDYADCAQKPSCGERYCDHSPQELRVHGGVTFADSCHEASRENFEKFRKRMKECEADAANGDSARDLRTKGHLRDDFEGWQKYAEGAFVCHIPLPGRPERVWWLGFDCAHAGDVSPAYERRYAGYDSYKDLSYVKSECASLAKQLREIASAELPEAPADWFSAEETKEMAREYDEAFEGGRR